MKEHFFNTDFQLDRYINERLLEIGDEEERKVLKELMKETLVPFYQQTEDAYKELEKRLLASKEEKRERFELITGIMNRNCVDITEEAMVPMNYGDIYDQTVDTEEMKESLNNGNAYTVMHVFFQMNYELIKQLEREERIYQGIIYTDEEEYPASFTVSRNQSYLKQISELYQVFEENGIEWKTVCSPYLYKYFDVKVIRTECPMNAEIRSMTVDFDEYQKYAQYNLIPMWNIRILEERSSAYPSFSIDRIHYEHSIYKERLGRNRDYLVDGKNIKVWNKFQLDDDMHIICDSDKPVRWKLVEFNYEAYQKDYEYPVFSNYQSEADKHRIIHTYGEARRYIKGLGYEKYMELEEIVPIYKYSKKDRNTYSVDDFMEDEIRMSEQRPCMLFQFRPINSGYYLNEDIMSYLVSRIQWQLPEYDCIGELI